MSKITVIADLSTDVAEAINMAFKDGNITTVNGETIKSQFGGPVATAWLNGTISIKVQARTTRGTTDRFFKVGQTFEVV